MLRRLLLAAAVTMIFSGTAVKPAFSAAGDLDKPAIAVPSQDGTPSATATAINAVLAKHEKQFAGGHFVNAHTVLTFAGGTKTINSLLAELSTVEGAALYVRFSRGTEVVSTLVESEDEAPPPFDCVISHTARPDANSLFITIRLDGNVAIEELSLPPIRGQEREKAAAED